MEGECRLPFKVNFSKGTNISSGRTKGQGPELSRGERGREKRGGEGMRGGTHCNAHLIRRWKMVQEPLHMSNLRLMRLKRPHHRPQGLWVQK